MLLTEQSAIRGGKATYRGDLRPRELVEVKVRLNDEAKKKLAFTVASVRMRSKTRKLFALYILFLAFCSVCA